MARMDSDSYTLSLTSMMAAFALLFIYLAGILPTARMGMYAIASLFSIALCMEQRTAYAIILYFAVSALSFLILPNTLMVVPYILFFGYYGIAKYHIESIKDKLLAFALKLMVFNIGLILNYFLAKNMFLVNVPDAIKNSFWLFLGLAQLAFLAYDYIFSKMAELYDNRIRKFLMKRGRR
ncbi:MAG: hypothetical protein AB1Z19_02565 [Eubacteriales bacterium]